MNNSDKSTMNTAIVLDVVILWIGLIGVGLSVWAMNRAFSFEFWGNLFLLVGGVAVAILYMASALRLVLYFKPIKAGLVDPQSGAGMVHIMHNIMWANVFYPLCRVLPITLSRVFYKILGAKIGANSYISGILFDPFFVTIGSNSTVGAYALIAPHIDIGDRFYYYPIHIGDNVMIGGHAVVYGGCRIMDGATVSGGSVVSPRTVIRPGEIWAGNPARLVGQRRQLKKSATQPPVCAESVQTRDLCPPVECINMK